MRKLVNLNYAEDDYYEAKMGTWVRKLSFSARDQENIVERILIKCMFIYLGC